MITTEDIADLTLHHMGRTGFQPFLVVIGAMDGVSYDDFHGYISRYRWSGLFVEPIPEQFRRLQRHYANLAHKPANKYQNSAVASHDGTTRMLTINQDAIDQGTVDSCFGGMSAIDPPRNGLASAADAATVARYGAIIDVNCVTLATLFKRHAIERVDLFSVDAEGWDYEVIRQFDFSACRPRLIRCEYVNLRPEEQSAIVELLESHGYIIRIEGQNIDGVAMEYWREVDAARPPRSAPVARDASSRGVTIVCSVFDLSRGEADLSLRRAFGRYVDQFKRLLQVDWPMIVFASPEFAEMLRRSRSSPQTFIVEKSVDDLQRFPFSAQLRAICRQHSGTASERPDQQALHHALALSKQFFLNDAAIYNPFGTEYFLWVDGDIAGEIGDPAAQFTDECRRNLAMLLSGDRMLYVGRPAEPTSDATGFGRSAMAAFAGQEPPYLVGGRIFGGDRRTINAINAAYYSCLGAALEAGHLGTEEQLLTITSYTHRRLCHVQMLDTTRPLRAFFDRLQHGVPDQAEHGGPDQ